MEKERRLNIYKKLKYNYYLNCKIIGIILIL